MASIDNIDLSGERTSYQAAFALDVITAAAALGLVVLATRPTFQRIKARRLSITSKDRPAPLKTSLGTYLFLYPALIFIFVRYTLNFVSDLLKTSGTVEYDQDLALQGSRPFSNSVYHRSIAVLSLVSAFLSILYTVLINGGVWIYSSHTLSNGTGKKAPRAMSKIYNTLLMLTMLATGIAAWGYGVSERSRDDTWATAVDEDRTTRNLFVVYRAIVVAASISVSVQVAKETMDCSKHSTRDAPERRNLARFAYVVVPLIWLRNAFIVYDIVLLYVNTASSSTTAVLATRFLLIVFGQIANITILGMILWGAWRTGTTVPLFDRMS